VSACAVCSFGRRPLLRFGCSSIRRRVDLGVASSGDRWPKRRAPAATRREPQVVSADPSAAARVEPSNQRIGAQLTASSWAFVLMRSSGTGSPKSSAGSARVGTRRPRDNDPCAMRLDSGENPTRQVSVVSFAERAFSLAAGVGAVGARSEIGLRLTSRTRACLVPTTRASTGSHPRTPEGRSAWIQCHRGNVTHAGPGCAQASRVNDSSIRLRIVQSRSFGSGSSPPARTYSTMADTSECSRSTHFFVTRPSVAPRHSLRRAT
jgi:hypothetical protein